MVLLGAANFTMDDFGLIFGLDDTAYFKHFIPKQKAYLAIAYNKLLFRPLRKLSAMTLLKPSFAVVIATLALTRVFGKMGKSLSHLWAFCEVSKRIIWGIIRAYIIHQFTDGSKLVHPFAAPDSLLTYLEAHQTQIKVMTSLGPDSINDVFFGSQMTGREFGRRLGNIFRNPQYVDMVLAENYLNSGQEYVHLSVDTDLRGKRIYRL